MANLPVESRSNQRRRYPFRRADILALIAGLLTPLAYAPFGLFPFAIVNLGLLFALWHGSSPARSAWRGFLFGIGMFGAGVSWVYVSMHDYGNMPAPMAAVAVLLFVSFLALYPAVVGWVQARFAVSGTARQLLVFLPALWVLAEWVRGWFLSGFPWLNLGYSQVAGPLAGLAPWLGIYGVSLVTALSAGLVALVLRQRGTRRRHYIAGFAVLWAVCWLAGKIVWVQPSGPALKAALVQNNVALNQKWSPEHRAVILQAYLGASRQHRDAGLIVWPEAAIPTYLQYLEPAFVRDLKREAEDHDTDFLIGVVELVTGRARRHVYNSVISVGSTPGVYRKRHLVPFGEFLPLKPLLGWLLNYLHIPMSDFSAGPGGQPSLRAAGQAIGVSICYEDAFGEEVIEDLPQASLLVNVSEDAWFGRSLAPHQRVQMARMRAMETGRPMLRAANTGPSAVIDHRGKVLARSPQFMSYVLTAEVQPMQGTTPYVRFGNWPVVILSAVMLLIGRYRRGAAGLSRAESDA